MTKHERWELDKWMKEGPLSEEEAAVIEKYRKMPIEEWPGGMLGLLDRGFTKQEVIVTQSKVEAGPLAW